MVEQIWHWVTDIKLWIIHLISISFSETIYPRDTGTHRVLNRSQGQQHSTTHKHIYCDVQWHSTTHKHIAMYNGTVQLTLLTSKISMELKKRIIRSTVWSVMMYGAETWTLTQADRKRIEAFEMWIWRRMLKISWTEKVSNEEVLMKVGEQRNVLNIISRRKHNWIGHILRHGGLLKTILEGRMEGKAARGRRRLNMLSDILKNDSYAVVKRLAEDGSGQQRL